MKYFSFDIVYDISFYTKAENKKNFNVSIKKGAYYEGANINLFQ